MSPKASRSGSPLSRRLFRLMKPLATRLAASRSRSHAIQVVRRFKTLVTSRDSRGFSSKRKALRSAQTMLMITSGYVKLIDNPIEQSSKLMNYDDEVRYKGSL